MGGQYMNITIPVSGSQWDREKHKILPSFAMDQIGSCEDGQIGELKAAGEVFLFTSFPFVIEVPITLESYPQSC